MQARIWAGNGEDYRKLQMQLDKLQMVQWVHSLAPWQVIAHLTFRWEVSLDSARRLYERFMRKKLASLSYFYAEEQNPSRDGYHVHALWADCKGLYRKEAWHSWFHRFGRARIEPVRSEGDVASYCSKYVTKEGAWWNVKLQWHRSQALRSEPFNLERGPEVDRRAPLPVPQREFGFAPQVFNLAGELGPAGDQVAAVPALPDPRQTTLWKQRSDGVWESQ